MVQGSHTHFGDVRSEWGSPGSRWDEGDAFYALLSTPSISPVFGNNPGFTTFDITDGKVFNVEFTFLDLNKTIGESRIPNYTFRKTSFKDYGLDEWNPTTVKEFLI